MAGLPLIQARLLPWMSMVRRSSRYSFNSNPAPSSQVANPMGASNSALTSVRLVPSRISPTSALPPVTSCSASIKIDFPAPVSPVSTVNPLDKSRSSSLTITKSRRTIRFKPTVKLPLHSSAVFRARYQSKTIPLDAKNGRDASNV